KMPEPEAQDKFCTKADGYRGFWYGCTPAEDRSTIKEKYAYKYSGGLGTYCAKHRPFAVYSEEVNKTFFCYGGTVKNNYRKERTRIGENQLLHMVSYFDHDKGVVPKPTILLDKWCSDCHDNPVISLDEEGYIWIFSSSHGHGTTPSYIHKSREPYSIDSFETVKKTLYAYPQVKYIKGKGFSLFHTYYQNGRQIRFMKSTDGNRWSDPVTLAKIDEGHYQISNANKDKLGTAFNYHPANRELPGLEYRSNLYYLETEDFGDTWKNIEGEEVEIPLVDEKNPALVYDFQEEGLNVYMKDLIFDEKNRPIILFITSKGHEPGPENNPRTWTTAHWTGAKWEINEGMISDSNYDMGTLHLENNLWKLIAPTETGPQPFNPGGEVAIWETGDQGKTWTRSKQITDNSSRNHTYIRRPLKAHQEFYGFWADGHGRKPSPSFLYFTDKDGRKVRRLPSLMNKDFEKPNTI
ncbi:MAG: BNR-4 repeat-containing protein, partial [Halanaerobiaceae bacterium]